MDDDDYVDIRERLFHNTVREYVIFLLIFLVLFILGSTILDVLRIKDREDYYSTDEEEATVYKVSMYLCVFALSVTICAALLLPASIASNEVLLLYPKSYYVKWLNHSLIQGIWNLVFLFSNVSLFGLLPFAYLFTESEGLSGCRRGMKSRVYETCTVLVLIAFIVFGLTYVISALLDTNETSFFAFKNFSMYYLPFLYSCISFLGVILLLIFTPLGFISLFGLVSRSLVKPQFLQDINEEYYKTLMEEDLIKRRLELVSVTGKSYLKPEPMSPPENGRSSLLSLQNGALQTGLKEKLEHLKEKREILQTQKETSRFRRNVIYPIAMLLLFLLTITTIFLVLVNSLMLLIGVKALPKSTAQFTLGITSLSKLGLIGAVIEVVVIFYLAVTSCVGLYSLPFLNWLRPQKAKTPLSLLIANCALLLILSSALPLLARILGITNFDLLGHYGKIEWLGNFNIVFAYNILFAGVTALCLFNKFTTPVCKELFNRIKSTLSLAMQLKGRSFLSTSVKNTPIKED